MDHRSENAVTEDVFTALHLTLVELICLRLYTGQCHPAYAIKTHVVTEQALTNPA